MYLSKQAGRCQPILAAAPFGHLERQQLPVGFL